MAITYDLDTHHPCFIGDWQDRNREGMDNTWMIKPTHSASEDDIWITNNPEHISRLIETGPKVAQKCIEKPLTLQKKKIDFQFIVALRSVKPLELFLVNQYFVRSAREEFNLDDKKQRFHLTTQDVERDDFLEDFAD